MNVEISNQLLPEEHKKARQMNMTNHSDGIVQNLPIRFVIIIWVRSQGGVILETLQNVS